MTRGACSVEGARGTVGGLRRRPRNPCHVRRHSASVSLVTPRRLGVAVAALLLLATTGCQVTLVARIQADADGTGEVQAGIGLDDGALAELGDPVTELRLDDLRQAGWSVAGPAKEQDGLTWVRLAHRFESAAEATRLAAQLGPPFRDLALTRKRTFLKSKTALTGLVDMSEGVAAFSDPGLQEALAGVDLGPVTDESLRVRLEASLHGRTRTWAPKVGEQVRVEAAAEVWNRRPVAAAVAALVFAVTGLVVFAATRH